MQPQVEQIPDEMTVNEAVQLWPGLFDLFNDYGMDTCCGGESPIRDSATREGLDPDEVVAAVLRLIREQAA